MFGVSEDPANLFDPVQSRFHLSSGIHGIVEVSDGEPFGPAGANWLPVMGDWNDSGNTGVGLYNPTTSTFYLRNDPLHGGPGDIVFEFGAAGAGWLPLAGDWNGDGVDTVGLYDPVNSVFFLRNQNVAGIADMVFGFGPGGSGWTPLEGDFNGNGQHTVGLYNPVTSTFFLRNAHAGGPADIQYNYGPGGAGWVPVMGDWDRPVMPQLLDGPEVEPSADTRSITTADLQPTVAEAIARWSAAGLDANLAAQLATVTIEIADLPGNMLGAHVPGLVQIDVNAAGHGWFIDATPSDEVEFANGEAAGQADLLSTIMHEMGHELGLIDLSPNENVDDVMRATLPLGVRFSPSAENLDEVYATLG